MNNHECHPEYCQWNIIKPIHNFQQFGLFFALGPCVNFGPTLVLPNNLKQHWQINAATKLTRRRSQPLIKWDDWSTIFLVGHVHQGLPGTEDGCSAAPFFVVSRRASVCPVWPVAMIPGLPVFS